MKANQIRQLSSIKYRFSFALIFLLCCGIAQAKVKGHCSTCHTMHNSENGSVLISGGTNQALLRQDCVGCHTGDNSDSDGGHIGEGGTPFVHYTDDVDNYGIWGITGTTLAGGTFHFIDSDGNTGHNVTGIDISGGPGIIPPGYNTGETLGIADAAGDIPGDGAWSENDQVTCAGTYGCHGNHDTSNEFEAVHGGHHQGVNGGAIDPSPDSNTTPAAGYRMLVGIAGYEDSDWEYQPDSSHHNQYYGSTTPGQQSDPSTINYLCAQCHGQFHSPVTNLSNEVGGSSPWLRHPTEYSMKETGEYANYSEYLPATPLASTEISAIVSTVTFVNDTIVSCISCHRAHGSPYYKSMRWDYAGDSSGGLCVNCHSSKN